MTPVRCNRQASKAACAEPGDYCFLIADREGDRTAGDDETPTHIYFVDPAGNRTRLPIKPTANGWDWNGDRESPSLKPSIRTDGGQTWKGWHGWLGNGVMADA